MTQALMMEVKGFLGNENNQSVLSKIDTIKDLFDIVKSHFPEINYEEFISCISEIAFVITPQSENCYDFVALSMKLGAIYIEK